jgi:alkanesulfonate monooxygenase SsuD/methylene tetrahydromethanopterin reductase-like flavin-dependent oxidoreductase (luciferase family)
MRIGVELPMSAGDGASMPGWESVRRFAQQAEQFGFDSLWVCDHFLSDPGDRPVEGIHEAWTILSALAAVTTSVELGQLVMCAAFRNPGLLAKMAVTADAVSGGRIVLGVGAGWYDAEHEAFGYPTDHRVSRFEEAVRILDGLLDGDTVSFRGRFHQAEEARLLPSPERRIPLLIAGNGARMLGITARYADAWNTAWYGMPDEQLHLRLGGLAAALAVEDREPTTIRRTVGVWVGDPELVAEGDRDSGAFYGSTADLTRLLALYEDLGIDDLIVGLTPMSTGSLGRLAAARDAGSKRASADAPLR